MADDDDIMMADADEDIPAPGLLSRSGRRASISMPQGLDLLVKIAEYSWQTKPQMNSSFDDLAEAGIADASPSPIVPSRRIGQHAGPSKVRLHGEYAPVQSESDGDEISDLSEIESPISPEDEPLPHHSKGKPRKVGISLDPKGRHVVDPDDDTEPKLKPLATRRKSGIMPIRISNSNFLKSDPDSDEESKPESPTMSVSSVKNLVRDKLRSMPIPGVFRKNKPREYKLQAFVAILFLTIILLVGSIYVIHQEKELQKSYFNQIRFSGKDRRFKLTNLKGREVLRGVLGANLSKRDKPWPCLSENEKEEHTCLEWMDKARLYFGLSSSNSNPASNTSTFQCYEIFWLSLSDQTELKDCFELGGKLGGHFYGGGEIPGSNHWPLNKTSIPFSPFLTGNKVDQGTPPGGKGFQWGRTLNRYFVNSDGAAIQITEDTPLHVSINDNGDGRICIGAKSEGYNFGTEQLRLNYTICSGDNVLDVSNHLADKDIWDGVKHEDLQITRLLAQSPLWRILPEKIDFGNRSETALLNHTDRIAALHLSEGFILLDESWQRRIGDLEMDPERFPTMAETLNITRRRGFKVALTIQPFFSTQSENYVEGLGIGGGIWLAESRTSTHQGPSERRKVPALTEYKNWTSVAVLDPTNREAQTWLENKVSKLVQKYGIDALYIDLGTSYDLPQYFEFSQNLLSSDYSKDLFLKSLRQIKHLKTIGVSSAVKLPKLPTFVSLSPTESSWVGLQSVIPNILTMGISGYPFIIPGSIGGDFFPNKTQSSTSSLPDRNLYIRWLELVHFLPVVQYSFLPSDYDQKVVDIANQMNVIRKSKLYPYIKKAIDESLKTGLPVIRPMWMIDPLDSNCLKVSDQFSIGGDIVVAPVITLGQWERDIYLPKGKWMDETDGSPTKGEKWLHQYHVKEDQIPFFTKMSE